MDMAGTERKYYWFFLSYARLDGKRDPYLKRFYDELNEEVRLLTGEAVESIGFFDRTDMEPGAHWPIELGEALSICRAFVCVLSPTYVTREYCGKEWQIFYARQYEHFIREPGTKPPPLMFPILWVPENILVRLLPTVVSNIQYDHLSFGRDYVEQGLRQLRMLRSAYKRQYQTFLRSFALRLIATVRQYPLPPLQTLQDIKQVQSAWVAQTTPHADRGPGGVEYVFLAGDKQELSHIRARVDYYDDKDGAHWRPFLPESSEAVALIAQGVTCTEKLYYQALSFTDSLIDRIREAESNNHIVIVLVDIWTIQVPKYQNFWVKLTMLDLPNTAVLVLWNNDDETRNNQRLLEDTLWKEFVNTARLKDSNSVIDQISSAEKLKAELSAVLHRTRMKVIEADKNIKKAGSGLASPIPTITGPVGRPL